MAKLSEIGPILTVDLLAMLTGRAMVGIYLIFLVEASRTRGDTARSRFDRGQVLFFIVLRQFRGAQSAAVSAAGGAAVGIVYSWAILPL